MEEETTRLILMSLVWSTSPAEPRPEVRHIHRRSSSVVMHTAVTWRDVCRSRRLINITMSESCACCCCCYCSDISPVCMYSTQTFAALAPLCEHRHF